MKLIYVVAEDWYFYSHRLPMMRGAVAAGFDVTLVTNVTAHKEAIEALGVRVISWSLKRESLNPFTALKQIFALVKIYRQEKPDIIHHVALKPILFGSVAAVIAKTPRVLNAFAGLGIIFHGDTGLAKTVRPLLTLLFRLLLKRKGFWLLFQNRDDLAKIARLGLVEQSRAAIIRGSGVEVDRYTVTTLPQMPPFICAYAGRMIDSKGLPTMYEAFEFLKTKAPHIKLWLCGKPDSGNPGTWDEARLQKWCKGNPNIEWKGHQAMADIWPHAHLALQPSWGGEGLPKALLEAGACARAMVASDVSGCREVVKPGVNGILVPAENPQALAEAILQIASDPERCAQMGRTSRRIVEEEFSADYVTEQTAALYTRILKS